MSEAEHLRQGQTQRCRSWLEYIRPETTLAGDVRLKWLRWLVALGRVGGPDDGAKRRERN